MHVFTSWEDLSWYHAKVICQGQFLSKQLCLFFDLRIFIENQATRAEHRHPHTLPLSQFHIHEHLIKFAFRSQLAVYHTIPT